MIGCISHPQNFVLWQSLEIKIVRLPELVAEPLLYTAPINVKTEVVAVKIQNSFQNCCNYLLGGRFHVKKAAVMNRSMQD